jgi:hypothetical protein
MNRNSARLKNGIILTAIMLLVTAPFIGTSFVYANDGSRYRNDPSSVFAPGYLNAAKHHAEVARKQRASAKNVSYLQGKTASGIEESTAEKPKPKLQQKSGAKSSTNTESAQTGAQQPKANPGDANRDGIVDMKDFTIVAVSWLSKIGDARYNSAADFNQDGAVNDKDAAICAAHYGVVYDISSQGDEDPVGPNFYTDSPLGREEKMVRYSDDYMMYENDYNTNKLQDTGKAKKRSLSGADQVVSAQPEGDIAEKDTLAVSLGAPIYKGTERMPGVGEGSAEDRKVLLAITNALLADMAKVREGAEDEPDQELQKAEAGLLKVIADLLSAQAMTDLLKKGDMAGMMNIFSDLDTSKKQIFAEYEKLVKPYYDSIIKEIAKNMAILQLKKILSGDLSGDQIAKLPPSELDKIIAKIKNEKRKAFEEEYILQQETKYRKAYLDPGKKKLGEDMTKMLKGFTGRINDALNTAEKK